MVQVQQLERCVPCVVQASYFACAVVAGFAFSFLWGLTKGEQAGS